MYWENTALAGRAPSHGAPGGPEAGGRRRLGKAASLAMDDPWGQGACPPICSGRLAYVGPSFVAVAGCTSARTVPAKARGNMNSRAPTGTGETAPVHWDWANNVTRVPASGTPS